MMQTIIGALFLSCSLNCASENVTGNDILPASSAAVTASYNQENATGSNSDTLTTVPMLGDTVFEDGSMMSIITHIMRDYTKIDLNDFRTYEPLLNSQEKRVQLLERLHQKFSLKHSEPESVLRRLLAEGIVFIATETSGKDVNSWSETPIIFDEDVRMVMQQLGIPNQSSKSYEILWGTNKAQTQFILREWLSKGYSIAYLVGIVDSILKDKSPETLQKEAVTALTKDELKLVDRDVSTYKSLLSMNLDQIDSLSSKLALKHYWSIYFHAIYNFQHIASERAEYLKKFKPTSAPAATTTPNPADIQQSKEEVISFYPKETLMAIVDLFKVSPDKPESYLPIVEEENKLAQEKFNSLEKAGHSRQNIDYAVGRLMEEYDGLLKKITQNQEAQDMPDLFDEDVSGTE